MEAEKTQARITGRNAIGDELVSLLRKAKHEFLLLSPTLDSYFFNTISLTQALADFAAGHGRNRGRILIEDGTHVKVHNERFLETCRRFSDFFQLRIISEDHSGNSDMFIVIDHSCVFHQQNVNRPDGVLDCVSKSTIAQYIRRFNSTWERSEPFGLHTLGLT